jgi:hypothetical protein
LGKDGDQLYKLTVRGAGVVAVFSNMPHHWYF